MSVLSENKGPVSNTQTNHYSHSYSFTNRLYMLTIVSFVVICWAGSAAMADYGTLTLPGGSKYVGEHKGGVPNGQGICTEPDGTKYVGEWKDGKENGQGSFTFQNGEKYVDTMEGWLS